MHYGKVFAVTAITLLLLGTASALDFRTEEPVDFFSDMDMNGNLVKNLSDPVDGGDAVPLDYIQGRFVERDGDTFSGDLNLNGNYIVDSPTTGQVSTYGLVGYWPFQDDQSYFKDWSEYGNDGTLTGGEIVEGKVGRAVSFDGTGGYGNLEDSSGFIEGEENVTISAWFKTRDDNGLILGSGISQTDSGYWLAIRDSELEFRATSQDGETVTIDTPVSNDEWHHGTASIGNGEIKLYLDGKLEVNSSFSGELIEMEGDNLNTGSLDAGNSETDALPFNGKIDELRIYNRGLNLLEAKRLYQMGINGKQEIGGAWLSREGGVIYGSVDMDGDLDLSGNDIINPGDVDGVDLDNPGNALNIANSRYRIPKNAIENDEINNSESITVDGLKSTDNLNLTGNNITSVDTLNFESGATINGSLNMTGDLNLNGSSIKDLDSINGGGDAVQFENSIDMQENQLANVDSIKDNQNQSTITFDGSNSVEIPNGDLSMGKNQIENIGTGGTFYNSGGGLVIARNQTLRIQNSEQDNSRVLGIDDSDNLQIGAGTGLQSVEIPNKTLNLKGNDIEEVGGITFQDGNQDSESWRIEESSTTNKLVLKNETGSEVLKTGQNGTLKIPNGDLDMGDNEVENASKVGVGTSNAQEDLDVDGTASVQKSGTELSVKSNGNVVVKLG